MPRLPIVVAAAGVLGATSRWAVGELIQPGWLPWPTLLVNAVGCAIVGASVATWRRRPAVALTAGFCGGLTTMSGLAVELANLARDDRAVALITYLLLTTVAGVMAHVVAGSALTRQRGRFR